MRFMHVVFAICFVFLICLFCWACEKDKSKANPDSKSELLSPPISYQPKALGQHTRIIYDHEADSLFLLHDITVSYDTLGKMDYLFSNVEIFNNHDSLLYRYCKDAVSKNSLWQKISIKHVGSDSFVVQTWGFGYLVKESNQENLKSNKLYFATSPKFEQKFQVTK